MIRFDKNSNFKEIVDNNKLVLFDFRLKDCSRCDTLEQEIEEYLKTNDLLVYSVSVEDNMKLVRSLNIYAAPCLMMYYNHKLYYRNLGTFKFSEFVDKINEIEL